MKTEDWALLISIISLLVSFYALFQNKKINCINLQADYYKTVFEDYLLKEIPIAVRMLKFNEFGKLYDDYKEITKVFIKMLEDCTYFAYANNDFYEKLSEKIIELDDKLVNTANVIINKKDKQSTFIYEIHQDIQSIIKLINKSYMS